MHTPLRLEAPATATEGLDAATFRGFQLAGELFLLTSFFIEPKGDENFEVGNIWLREWEKVRTDSPERLSSQIVA